jgi:hypothetical protein
MSVSQVKKRFGEFESFLRSDKEGLRRLKLLKDDVNVLRNDLAAATEAKETAEVVKDAARDRADAAEAEATALRLEVHSLQQQVSSLMTDLATVTKPGEKIIDKDDPNRLIRGGDYDEYRDMVKRLRKILPHCPKPHQSGKRRVFLREHFSEGFSHQSLWTIGASVVLIAACEGEVTIIDPLGLVLDRKQWTEASIRGLDVNVARWYANARTGTQNRSVTFKKTLDRDQPGDVSATQAFLYGDD